MTQTYDIRKPVPSDVEFMLKTWLRVMRRSFPRNFPDRLYFNEFQQVILALTRKSDARVVCSVEDPNFIVGFMVANYYLDAESAVVHFAYVRPPFRRAGLMKACLADLGYKPGEELIATHWSPYMDRFRVNELIYNPLVLYKVE